MRVVRWMGGGTLALVLSAVPCLAQEETRVRTDVAGTTSVRRVSTIIGSTVHVAGGTSFGRVEDIVLNDRGCIEYIVLAHESNYIVVPWTVATVQFDRRLVVLDIARDRILQAPTFTRDRWVVLGDTAFTQRVNTFFDVTDARDRGAAARDPARRDPAAKDPAAKDPAGKEPTRRDPAAKPGDKTPPKATPPADRTPPATDPPRKPATPGQPEDPVKPKSPTKPPKDEPKPPQ